MPEIGVGSCFDTCCVFNTSWSVALYGFCFLFFFLFFQVRDLCCDDGQVVLVQ